MKVKVGNSVYQRYQRKNADYCSQSAGRRPKRAIKQFKAGQIGREGLPVKVY